MVYIRYCNDDKPYDRVASRLLGIVPVCDGKELINPKRGVNAKREVRSAKCEARSECEMRNAKREVRNAELGKGIVGDGALDIPLKPSSKLCKREARSECEMRNAS